ncbi:hypothetical protein C9J01_15865 [Photobacterium rosenbergii]|uniref:Uncharacterized protein n=1 Tax=Photobacterium rosenbergii TaxID=294936 RepID=A0A2T3NBV9_9GAMM|nr:hypothetical protein [Photobacterium rosenbergii]PSW11433.1 hypothetical protein C9J01_15865 [Photobacterium rosenbergii]
MNTAADTLYRINITLPTGWVRVGSMGKYKFPIEQAKLIASEYEADGYQVHFTPARQKFRYVERS